MSYQGYKSVMEKLGLQPSEAKNPDRPRPTATPYTPPPTAELLTAKQARIAARFAAVANGTKRPGSARVREKGV